MYPWWTRRPENKSTKITWNDIASCQSTIYDTPILYSYYQTLTYGRRCIYDLKISAWIHTKRTIFILCCKRMICRKGIRLASCQDKSWYIVDNSCATYDTGNHARVSSIINHSLRERILDIPIYSHMGTRIHSSVI